MENQKLENLLNLSLQATPEEREQSQNLESGYQEATRTWELIVKYHGNLQQAASEAIQIEELLAGYAIVQIPEQLINAFSILEQVEYIEKPKRLFFEQVDGNRSSCVYEVTRREPYLSGNGVLIGIADSGIDYRNPEFIDQTGKTRIIALWDQSLNPALREEWQSPAGYNTGVLFSESMINEALALNSIAESERLIPSRDSSGHGTAVASVAAGSTIGVAQEAKLIVVKLGNVNPNSFPQTTELMRAVNFMLQTAIYRALPIAINLSFGSVYGNHLGSSLLERYMDNASEVYRNVICVGSGNEAASGGHYSGRNTGETQRVELAVGNYEPSLSIQFWKNYNDILRISIIAPSGERRTFQTMNPGVERIVLGNTKILCYFGTPLPYSAVQEFYFDFLPNQTYLTTGIWTFEIEGVSIRNGVYNMYLSSYSVRNADTGFFISDPNGTLTIPSTSRKVITVGAYNSIYNSYADFSGRGYESGSADITSAQFIATYAKPELVAPGVNVNAAVADGGYAGFTGTSFSTPYVTGAAALLLEWGIVRGNDPFLYGEKVKAYLIRGARRLPGVSEYPNPEVGWGALCVQDSLPV
ncbi:MAG TPA: S8 family peptidase [Lachnospiraceae bacterium]|nr:S8 family peptidase [Lachnospiraceae bacterium]